MSRSQHQISLTEAIDLTTRYRAHRPAEFPICETFSLSAIQSLIDHPSAAFLRIYYGMKEDMSVHAVLVVADAEDNDLLPSASRGAEDDDNEILEDSIRCPNACPPDSPLNS